MITPVRFEVRCDAWDCDPDRYEDARVTTPALVVDARSRSANQISAMLRLPRDHFAGPESGLVEGMSMLLNMRLIRAVVAGAVVLAVVSVGSPVAHAVPGDPMPGCETGAFNSMWCDGPIREDGTWKRCSTWQPYFVPGPYGSYTPGGSKCEINGGDPPHFMFLSPDHHIDG